MVLEDPADEHGRLRDGGREGDGAVGVEVALGAEDGGEECHEQADVRKASGVVLDPAPQGGKVMDRAFASVKNSSRQPARRSFLSGGIEMVRR